MQELQNTADWQSETSDGSILGEKNQRNIFAELYISDFQDKHTLYFSFHGIAYISTPQIIQKTECL